MLTNVDSISGSRFVSRTTVFFLKECAERRAKNRRIESREIMRLMDVIGGEARESGITDADIEAVLNEK